MPRYDYRCKECREITSVERSMKDSSDDATCEHCGCQETSRIWNMQIRSGGITPDVGQGSPKSSSKSSGGGCGSCCGSSCSSC
jgi:putative FmdB family regulatory protein